MKGSAILSAVLMTLILCSQAAAKPLELVTLQYPPYEYEENKKVKGIAVNIVKTIFSKMGYRVSIRVLPWARALLRVEKGDADAIFTAYKTPEREKFADYSRIVLMPQEISLFVLKDSKIKFNGDLGELYGYLFGVVRKVSYGKKFDEFAKNRDPLDVNVINTGELNMNMLLKKRIDILVSNKHGAYYILSNVNKTEMIRELKPALESVPSYMAFSKKRKLGFIRDKFDAILEDMKAHGEYYQIIDDFYKDLKKQNKKAD